MAEQPDWLEWHSAYDRDPSLRQRLKVVRQRVTQALDAQPAGPVRVLSLCAGQGRDLLPVVAGHPRRRDVRARLVELDARNVARARALAEAARLEHAEIVLGDAALTAGYEGAVPAQIVLVCGVFGNISDEDIAYTVENLPTLCAPEATVIWTRGRTAPDLTPAIRRWFGERGFDEVSFEGEPGSFGVGVHRLCVAPAPFDPGLKLFTFRGHGANASRASPSPSSPA